MRTNSCIESCLEFEEESAQLYWKALVDMVHSTSLVYHYQVMTERWRGYTQEVKDTIISEMVHKLTNYRSYDLTQVSVLLLKYAVYRTMSHQIAIAQFTQCISDLEAVKQPNTAHQNLAAMLHNARGVLHYNMRNYEEAISDFHCSISLNPSFAAPWSNMGLPHLEQGELDLAIELFSNAIKLDSDHEWAFYNRSLAYRRKNLAVHALRDASTAFQVHSDSENTSHYDYFKYQLLSSSKDHLF